MNKRFIIVLIAICLVSAYTLLQIGSPDTASRSTISYANDVQPILETRCGRCHMGEFTSADLHMETYESLMTGSQNGPVIIPGKANESLLAQKILKGEMPKRGPKLTPAQVQMIIDWINAGAQNN